MSERLFPELLAAAALAAHFVSEPYIWDQFLEWCLDSRIVSQAEADHMSRELMMLSSKTMGDVLRQIEVQLINERIRESLQEMREQK